MMLSGRVRAIGKPSRLGSSCRLTANDARTPLSPMSSVVCMQTEACVRNCGTTWAQDELLTPSQQQPIEMHNPVVDLSKPSTIMQSSWAQGDVAEVTSVLGKLCGSPAVGVCRLSLFSGWQLLRK